MRKYLFMLSVIFSAPFFGLAKDISIDVYDFPPHVLAGTTHSKPTGPAIDFFMEYLRPKGSTTTWQAAPFARVLADVEHQKVDLVMFLAKTPERLNYLRFSSVPLFTTTSAIIIPKKSKLAKARSLEEFRGLTLGHSQGSVTPPLLAAHDIKIDALSGENVILRNIIKLRNGRLDGIFTPTSSNAIAVLKRARMFNDFQLFEIPGSNLDLYLAFRKDIDKTTFDQIDRNIQKHHHKYQKLIMEMMKQ